MSAEGSTRMSRVLSLVPGLNSLPNPLILVLGVAVVARIAAAIYLGNTVVSLPGTADQVSYHSLAIRVMEGHGFSFGENWWPQTRAGQPTAHWSYLYVLFLAGIYQIFGVTPIIARSIQAVIVGVAQPLLAYLLGRELFGKRSGLAAAAITSLYGYFIYYSGTLMTEPFYLCAVLLALYLCVRVMGGWPSESRQEWTVGAALGLALGTGVLLRQLLLLMVPVVLLFVWWARSWRATRVILASILVVILMIAPFTLYNSTRFDQFVLLNTNAGFAFYWANHPIYGTSFVPILTESMGTYTDLIPIELRSLDEAALDRALLGLSVDFVLSDPIRYILLSISRVPAYFMFWPSQSSSLLSNLVRVSSFGFALPFIILGVGRALARREGAESIRSRLGVGLILVFAAGYTALHLLSWALVRYRLPVDAVLLVFAGSVVVWLYDLLAARLADRRPAGQVPLDQVSSGVG